MGLKYNDNGTLKDLKIIVDRNDTYSTTEQRIGTWIDGKPLYRKSYNTFTIESDNILLETKPNINMIKMEGGVKFQFQTYYYWRDISVIDSTMGTLRPIYNTDTNKIMIARSSFSTNYSVKEVNITVYYTKTTD